MPYGSSSYIEEVAVKAIKRESIMASPDSTDNAGWIPDVKIRELLRAKMAALPPARNSIT